MEEIEKNLKFIKSRRYVQDLHSFKVDTDKGITYVKYTESKYFDIDTAMRNSETHRQEWVNYQCKEIKDALKYLIQLGIKPKLIEV